MRVIRDDVHCTAVRITGGIPDRLEIAATHAADAGLEVWFCPFTNGLSQAELLDLFADCAERAERLRMTIRIAEAERDLDRASAGVVKMCYRPRGERTERFVDMPWAPKAAFAEVARCYERE